MPAKRGAPATDAQRAAGRENLAKGRAAKEEKRKSAKAAGAVKAKERWAMLLSGTITVKDLDDDEISRMRVRGKDGGFSGRPPMMPSNIAQSFHAEALRRAQDKFRTGAPEAVQALLDIGKDGSVKEGDRIRALTYIVDRALGKTPQDVNLKVDDPWSAMLAAGGSLQDVRDLSSLADETLTPEDLA